MSERVTESVEVDDVHLNELDGREYEIVSVRREAEFDIGISHSDDRKPLPEIIPGEIYESVAATVRDEIDVELLETDTDIDAWPQLGRCVLATREGNEVEVEITIFGP